MQFSGLKLLPDVIPDSLKLQNAYDNISMA